MPLRVGFDLDGTLADMHTVLRKHAEQLFGSGAVAAAAGAQGTPPPDEPKSMKVMAELRLTPPQQKQLWDHVRRIENFWGGLPEAEPGIVARLARTTEARRWEVIFLTTRPPVAGETTQVQSQRWLVAHGFPLPSVFVVRRSRGAIAEALELDAVVDDRPENCLDVALDSKARPILVWQGRGDAAPPGPRDLGVQVVGSISEALDLLERMDSEKSSPIKRSIARLFGRHPVR